MQEYKNVEVESLEKLKTLIESAKTVHEMNDLRYACVKWMKVDNGVLKTWQDKYWALKTCPTCGKLH